MDVFDACVDMIFVGELMNNGVCERRGSFVLLIFPFVPILVNSLDFIRESPSSRTDLFRVVVFIWLSSPVSFGCIIDDGFGFSVSR